MPELSKPQSLNRYTYAFENPVTFSDPDGHFPKPPCNSVTSGDCPDWYGLSIVKLYMSPHTHSGHQNHDPVNTYTAAGIAVQSQWPDYGVESNQRTSGKGIAQVSDAQMDAPYGKVPPECKEQGIDCGRGLGMPGLDQTNPGVAIVAMRRRIEQVLAECVNCTSTDKFIAAALAQNGPGFTKANMSDLVNGVYGACTPETCAHTSVPWNNFLSKTSAASADRLQLKRFTQDVQALEQQGWYVPNDIDWTAINNLTKDNRR